MSAIEVVITSAETRAEERGFLLHTTGGRIVVAAVLLGAAIAIFAVHLAVIPPLASVMSLVFLFFKCLLFSIMLCVMGYTYVNSGVHPSSYSKDFKRTYSIAENSTQFVVKRPPVEDRYPLNAVRVKKGISYLLLIIGSEVYVVPRSPNNELFVAQIEQLNAVD